MRTVRVRLSRIYQSLGDEEQQAVHERLAQCLEEELELQCGACNLPFGLDSDSLEALPCSHILHARYSLYTASDVYVYVLINFYLICAQDVSFKLSCIQFRMCVK
jgi:hypothetical protein